MRLDIRKTAAIKQGQDVIGNRTRVKVVKNQGGRPPSVKPNSISFSAKVCRGKVIIIDLASDNDIVEKTGAWYSYKGERIGQGRENAKTYLKENPDIRKAIEIEVRQKFNFPTTDKAEE